MPFHGPLDGYYASPFLKLLDRERLGLLLSEGPMEDSLEGRGKLAAMAFEASAIYEQVRPSYSDESVKFFLKKLGILEQQRAQPLSILELGAGTGKFTRVLIDVLKGIDARVIASDPTNTMVQEFQRVLPNVELLQCSAENIGRFSFILCTALE